MSKDAAESRTPDGDRTGSPFHDGELAVQRRLGVSAKIDRFGRVGIRDFMPEQHRTFFGQLSTFFIGSVDAQGRPWASVLCGQPGFIQSPNERLLRFASLPDPEDPFADSLRSGAVVGGLGIEFHSRRRNRVNGKLIIDPAAAGFDLRVDQSFGNCAKYIQARKARFLSDLSGATGERRLRSFTRFDGECGAIIKRCDTFFIASRFGADPNDPRHGVDMSHRGVPAGLLMAVDDRVLRWPDYRGNFFFNTFGNIEFEPRCGLLIVDFNTGDTLQLTGTANVLWEAPSDNPTVEGAQRTVEFRLEQGIHVANALPFVWDFVEQAPQFSNP